MPALNCATCGAELPAAKGGPGRPPSYCGVACRRLAELQIRTLSRRIDAYRIEQRELKYRGPEYFDDEREKRLRALRRWIRTDEERLRLLLAAGQGNQKPSEGIK